MQGINRLLTKLVKDHQMKTTLRTGYTFLQQYIKLAAQPLNINGHAGEIVFRCDGLCKRNSNVATGGSQPLAVSSKEPYVAATQSIRCGHSQDPG